jgi:hypothetical protein
MRAVEMARLTRSSRQRALPWLCFYGLAFSLVLIFGGRAVGDASSLLQQHQQQTAAKTFRPTTPADHEATLAVEDLHIRDLVNQRGVEIFTTSPDVKAGDDDAAATTFGEVVIRNCEIGNLRRDELGAKMGARVEGIRITGGGEHQPAATDVLIEDVYIHGGQGLPIRIQEGKFGTITFRRVRVEQMLTPTVQVAFINSGSAQRIEIEDSPGLVLRLMGRPGSVGEVATNGSPDARIQDELSDKPVAEVVADAGKTVEPVKLAVPDSGSSTAAAETAAKVDATKPAQAPAPNPKPEEPAKPMEVTAAAEGDSVRVTVANVPKNVSHITFGVFNRFDYRVGVPEIVTEAPWEAVIKVGKAGTYTARVTVTRTGGDSDRAIEKSVEVK